MQNLAKILISVMFYVFFGRIRAVVPNLSSAGFGRPSQIYVRPDSHGRPESEFGRIRTDDSKPDCLTALFHDTWNRNKSLPLPIPYSFNF